MDSLGPHVTKAFDYAHDVVDGKIPACKWVRFACERQIKDLNRKKFDYYFDVYTAEKICRFIEKLPHVKGEWAKQKQKIELEPWQCFLLTTAFGWLHKESGLRRFRNVYIEVPRKNAKSTISAGVALYMLTEDGEIGAEVYCSATNRKQSADIVFSDAKKMARQASGFQKHYGVTVYKYNISCIDQGNKFEPLHAEGGTLDGLNVHCAINDELHAHKKRDVHDVIETATGARAQPMMWDITTAGSNRAGICYEIRDYVTKILQKVVDDDQMFGIIYTIDDDDDWQDEKTWIKANPNWNVSVYPMQLRSQFKKAAEQPSYQNTFLTKYLNRWVNADVAWMNMIKWDKCADPKLKIEDFHGERCWAPIDLASKIDMCAMMQLFYKEIDGKEHVFAFGKYYLPEETVHTSTNSQYQGWARRKLLTVTPGNVTDYAYIETDLISLSNDYEIVEVPFDPHNATQFSTRMSDEGFTMVDVRPVVLNFSEPMKWLEALVCDGRFHYNGDPILTWMISNVVAHYDQKDNIYPRKERQENKIDGVVATIMGLNRIIADSESGKSIYDTRPEVYTV